MPTITRLNAMTSKRVVRSAGIDPKRIIGCAPKRRPATWEGSCLSTLSTASKVAHRTLREQPLLGTILGLALFLVRYYGKAYFMVWSLRIW